MKKRILKSIVVSLGILLLQSTSLLAGFGVSPTNVYNEFLKPGSHFEKTITLSRSDTEEELLVTIEPSLDEIESWFQFDPGLQFTFPSGETRKTFKIIVDVPETATYRSFEGVIRVRATDANGEIKGVSIVKGARLDVDLVTTEENVSDLIIRSLKMLDSIDGEPLQLEIVAENVGNIAVSPDAKIVIKNLLMEELDVLEDNDLPMIQPNDTDTFNAEFYSTLPEGEYFVEAEVLLDDKVLRKERLVFRIIGQREDEDQNTDSVGGMILSFVRDYWIYIILALIIVVLVYILLTKFWNSEKMEARKEKKWSIFFGARVVSRAIISILVALLLAGGSWFVVDTFLVVEDVEVAELEIEVEGDDVVQVEDEDTVKGITTQNPTIPDIDPFVVNIRDSKGNIQYPIYSEADFSSDIVYYAKEDETLAVLEEKANWFMVLIGGRVEGWLDKSMVKSAETVEQ